uniref:Mce/MlaD domain-containing protein n=1 Tax=Fagus sylvatica TaxID=28930 RepID=A0A2N9FZP9_FAGSY
MVGNPTALVSSCPKVLYSSIFTLPSSSSNCLPHFPLRSQKKAARIRATSADSGHSHPTSNVETRNPFSLVLDVPRNIWRQTLRPLNDFGFSRKSIWEGGVGLFLMSSTVLIALSLAWLRGFQIRSKFRKYLAVFEFAQACGICTGTPVRIRGVTVGNVIRINPSLKRPSTVLMALSLAWLRGFQMRSKFRKYLAVFEFAQACGICTGTPVRIRGVTVGNVIRINPSLKSIEAIVEVEDDKIVIPRNSFIEVNQSGLLMETLIDITPRNPIPTPFRIFTHLGREVEDIGIANSYALAERVFSAIEEAKPLLAKIKAMAEDVQPLLAEVRDSGLVQEIEKLTRSLMESSEELRRVQSSIMTPENTELIQNSIHTLLFTLKNIENISSDILGFTGDEVTRQNLKSLVKSLSRLL